MSKGINKVILIGRLGQDPEVKYMPSGGAVTNASLATSEQWKDKNTGQPQERTEWHRIVFFNRLGEIAGEYLRNNMEASGISKIQCPLFSITLVAGRDSVAISDESAIPDDFLNVKTVISPDKTAIAKALKDGQEVAGASLQRGQSSIRIK